MILDKLTRQRLHKAAGKPVEIVWPEDGPEPKVGRRYSVQASQKAGEAQMVVVGRKESKGGWKVKVKLDADPERPLPIKTRKGIEASPMGGPQFRAEREPEQVSAQYQKLLDAEGELKTVMQGNKQRQRAKVLESEQQLVDERKKGKPGTLTQAQFERQQKHLRRAA